MREHTGIKEMYIVRYADDFRIFCRTKTDAEATLVTVTKWLEKRLRLEVSEEKTRIVNVKRRYSDFLGFKIKVHQKSVKYVVKSHIADKKLKQVKADLVEQAKNVASPRCGRTEKIEVALYNQKVMGIHNYFQIATNVSIDCGKVNFAVMRTLTNRLGTQKGSRLVKSGRRLTDAEKERYGKSAMLRYVAGCDEPIYPIGYVQHRNPMARKRSINSYTAEGRAEIHNDLRINTHLMRQMMQQPLWNRTAEFADNRISLFSAQWGKCAITGKDFQTLEDIHCHHKLPKAKGGKDEYSNLVLILPMVHKLVHATQKTTIDLYLASLNLDANQLAKLNRLRTTAGLAEISMSAK